MFSPAEDGSDSSLDDIIEAVNHFKWFDYILDTFDKKIDSEYLKYLHLLLKRNTSQDGKDYSPVGNYKKYPNEIGDFQTTDPDDVADAIEKLINEYSCKDSLEIKDVIDFHFKFERIHPFSDGNGRVGRLIMYKECLKHNILPFILKNEHRAFYYRGLNFWREQVAFLLDTIGMEQDIYVEFLARMSFDVNTLTSK